MRVESAVRAKAESRTQANAKAKDWARKAEAEWRAKNAKASADAGMLVVWRLITIVIIVGLVLMGILNKLFKG